MPEEGVYKKNHEDIMGLEEYLTVIRALVPLGIDKVRITGGEPLVRQGIVDLVQNISDLKEIKEVAMTTNGILLKRFALKLKKAGLSRVNVSLDTLNPQKFNEITRGGNIQDVLEGIKEAKKVGLLPIKINVVVIKGFNTDEIDEFINMATDDVIVRFIELMPIGLIASNDSKFVSNQEIYNQNKHYFMDNIEQSVSPAKYYNKKESSGKVGFINPISSHFCQNCNRVRVTPDGKLKSCLHSNDELDLMKYIESPIELKKVLENGIKSKPKMHEINRDSFKPIERDMHRIGG